ncbi:MAG: TolC family protein, partial [Acidobacteria bacterium]|nr:TolC family protein [Acidobacteriota bacterium]
TALSAAAEAARNAAQLAQSRYIAGLTSYQPVLDTERSVLSIEDNLKSTEAEGTSALIRLYKALGGGWAPDTNEANSEESRARHLFHRMTSWPESWPKV